MYNRNGRATVTTAQSNKQISFRPQINCFYNFNVNFDIDEAKGPDPDRFTGALVRHAEVRLYAYAADFLELA
jgi:hypothetical protein